MRFAVIATAAVVAACVACTSHAEPPPSVDSTVTQTVVRTSSASPTYVPAPAKTVAPLPPGASPAAGEKEDACPYIASMPTDDPAVNVGDIDGSRVYRTTVLINRNPVGCRFYFWSDIYYAIADIVPTTFTSAKAAHNAMVLTGEAGKDFSGRSDIIAGVDAVVFRTKFLGKDGDQDWACAFARGKVMVVVHTEQTETSLNALELAKAVASKF
ncbi:MAG TPA: hypothetical protein VGL26_07765 [Jatrophihabitans sp.]|jgi:hypothetical protein